ncbi:MAG: hypothetical protein NWE78_05280 [Candidatus Bathyarchaeota archaeon]|nr:hypothetical protein [Candidatus Bathyarchaeota archaeon]
MEKQRKKLSNRVVREKYTEEAATQAKEAIKQATEKLDEIAKKLEHAD